MIKATIEGGFTRAYQALFRLETMTNYIGPLLEAWTFVLIEDNRRGVMQGLDGDGLPMKPTKYRLSLKQTSAGQANDQFFNSSGQAFSNMESAGGFAFANTSGTLNSVGFKGGASDNLTTRQYKKMTGPPLAPRGPASRVISNYTVEALTGENTVGVEGGWRDVVTKDGRPLLPIHFNGATSSRATFANSISGDNRHLPRRNLVGLRLWGKTQARKELNAWVKWLLTVSQPEYFGRNRAGHAPKYVRNKR
jgi:hypothetical protein